MVTDASLHSPTWLYIFPHNPENMAMSISLTAAGFKSIRQAYH